MKSQNKRQVYNRIDRIYDRYKDNDETNRIFSYFVIKWFIDLLFKHYLYVIVIKGTSSNFSF